MEAIQYQPYKIGQLCSHTLSNITSTNEVELICKQRQNIVHKVSQIGKICNKCASLIAKSGSESGGCLCCNNRLEIYLKDHWICQHSGRDHYEAFIKCLDNKEISHEVPFKSAVCDKCYNKIRASFNYADNCLVCSQKENEVFQNVEKTIALPSYYYYKHIAQKFKQEKVQENVAKQQIQLFCLAGQEENKQEKKYLYQNVVKQLDKNLQEYHISKRYNLFPRCQKHKNNPINICNSCVVSLLNIQCCPYGCQYEKKDAKKQTKGDESKISQTGFLSLYPKVSSNNEEYLQFFVFKHIQEAGRLDKWETHVRKIRKSPECKQSVLQKFTLYASTCQTAQTQYLYTGGAAGNHISNLKTVSQVFWINVSKDRRNFSVEEAPGLKQERSSHGTVYLQQCVYAIGGFQKQKMKCLSSCQKFDIQKNQWIPIAPLKIQRSKPTVFTFQGYLYALGGLSTNPEMMSNICERYDPRKDKWETLQYLGYDIPYINGTVALNSSWNFPKCSNLLTVGGSNYQEMSYLIQSFKIDDKSFSLNMDGIPEKINFGRCFPTVSLMRISKSDDYILLVFGGLEEHQDMMTVDAVRMKVSKNRMEPLFTYDQIMIGSFKFLQRQNTDYIYNYMLKKLEQQGILDEQKYDPEKGKNLNSEFNIHMIEKMWYGIGKCMESLSL